MLRGKIVTLRLVRESDLDRLHSYHTDIANRGDFFPQGVVSEPGFRTYFHDTGFWSDERGMLVIVDSGGEIVGHIEYFRTVNYLDEYELSYQVYAPEQRGRGVATEAVRLLVRYLFETKRIRRIRLIIHPDNTASLRLAERCGFRHEGTARQAWYHRGRHRDVEVYAIVQDEVLPE